jgi:hypothetical protein
VIVVDFTCQGFGFEIFTTVNRNTPVRAGITNRKFTNFSICFDKTHRNI